MAIFSFDFGPEADHAYHSAVQKYGPGTQQYLDDQRQILLGGGKVIHPWGGHTQWLKHSLNENMALALFILAKAYRQKPLQYFNANKTLAVHKVCTSAATFTNLRFWHLIEHQYHPKTGARVRGMYRITERGYAFLAGNILIDQFCFTLHAEPVLFMAPKISFRDCFDIPAQFPGFLPIYNVHAQAGTIP